MKAIKITVGFREWDKLGDFIEAANAFEETAAGAIDYTSAFVAASDDEAMEYVREQLGEWFNDYVIETIK